MGKLKEVDLLKNIVAMAKREKKTIEGVYFSNIAGDDFSFCIDTLSIIASVLDSESIKNITYFKCTKSGKLNTYRF